MFGFDLAADLDYVKYIQKTGSLPLANQGLEMFQAPLYYRNFGGPAQCLHYAASDLAGLRLLQIFNLLVGAADVALVWVGIGMLYRANGKSNWPEQRWRLMRRGSFIFCTIPSTKSSAACLARLPPSFAGMCWRRGSKLAAKLIAQPAGITPKTAGKGSVKKGFGPAGASSGRKQDTSHIRTGREESCGNGENRMACRLAGGPGHRSGSRLSGKGFVAGFAGAGVCAWPCD